MGNQTLKQALNGQVRRVIGTVESAGKTYSLGIRNNPGYGVIVPFLKVAGAKPYSFGRFGYETTVDTLIGFLKTQRLASDAVVTII